MRIAVCDDDIYMLRLLGDYLYRLRGSRLEFSVEFFKSSADFELSLIHIFRPAWNVTVPDESAPGAAARGGRPGSADFPDTCKNM